MALGEARAHRLGDGRRLVAVADVDLDLPAAQAGRDLDLGQRHPLLLHLAQALGDFGLGDAEHAQRVAVQRRRPPEQLPHAARSPAPPATSAAARAAGPGRTTIARSPAGTTRPGAVPTGSSGVAPSGTIACLRFASITAPSSNLKRLAKPRRTSAIFSSTSSSRTSSRPAKRATTSAVRSSAVGPRPPEVTIRSIPSSARKRSAASRSSGRSATTRMWATSTPSSASRSETQGPFLSAIRPVRTSVPVTTIPARTGDSLIRVKLPERLRASGLGRRPRAATGWGVARRRRRARVRGRPG